MEQSFYSIFNEFWAITPAPIKPELERELEAMDENFNHVEPKAARAFAESLVGDIYRETTKFDNEWN